MRGYYSYAIVGGVGFKRKAKRKTPMGSQTIGVGARREGSWSSLLAEFAEGRTSAKRNETERKENPAQGDYIIGEK